jgi:peptide/nickel transport system permease protein
MLTFFLRRLLFILPVVVGVSTVVFLVLQFIPGDPAQMILGDFATRQAVEALREELGLDQPLYVQYGRFLANLVTGDLGHSVAQRQPVLDLIMRRLPATIELAVAAMLVAIVLGISVGVLAAVNQNTFIDYLATTASLIGVSIPVFYLGLLLILTFSLNLGWLPVSGRGPAFTSSLAQLLQGNTAPMLTTLSHLALPALALGLTFSALIARMTRATMLEVLQQDFIRTAKAKGLSQRLVLYKHALRNASIPILTVFGLQFSALLGGSVLTETVFAWPGVGRMAVDAIFTRDFPLVQGTVLIVALVFVFVNLLVDLAYGLLDPRIQYT